MSDDDAVAGRHYKAAYQRQKAKNAELTGLLEILRTGNKTLVDRTHAQEREIAQLKKGNLALAEIDASVRAVQEIHVRRLENALLMIHDKSEDAEIRDIAVEAAKSIYEIPNIREVETRGRQRTTADIDGHPDDGRIGTGRVRVVRGKPGEGEAKAL